MTIEIKVPVLPESVADATIATWHKKPGEACKRDENLVDIETDKVVLEVVAPEDGVIESISEEEGATVLAEQVIAQFKAGGIASASTNDDAEVGSAKGDEGNDNEDEIASPAVRRMIAEKGLDSAKIKGSGKNGRITKEDVEKFAAAANAPAAKPADVAPVVAGAREEKRVPMTRLRQRIAERLVDAQQNAAILTTFNDVNMKPVMDIRKKYKDEFEKVHGVRLGFMSFFTKAAVEALKRFPAVNASIDGNDIVYHGFYDIGIAVSSPRGLVVPVLRNTENMSMADIEGKIGELGKKAQNNQITVDELTGGTFTISNGGVFGSMLSTPILNPPQSAILGLHRIEDKAVVENGEIVIRPMMYLALSYDHRIIDGRESVGFLKTIKEYLEDPARLLLSL